MCWKPARLRIGYSSPIAVATGVSAESYFPANGRGVEAVWLLLGARAWPRHLRSAGYLAKTRYPECVGGRKWGRHMRRRDLVSLLSSFLVVQPHRVTAQRQSRRRIGYIGGFPALDQGAVLTKSFLEGLAQYGWIAGKNIDIDFRWANARVDVAKTLAAELLNSGSELIVAPVAGAYDGASQATSTTPIVFCSHGDPIGLGHAKTLARPGGNMTGLSFYQAELSEKKLDLLLKVAPWSRQIGVIWDPKQPVTHSTRASVESAITNRGIKPLFAEIGDADDIQKNVNPLLDQVQSVFIIGSPLTFRCNELLAGLMIGSKMPAIFPFIEDAGRGALIVYAPDLSDLYRRCGGYVDRILRGASPADLPIEQPTKFSMMVNLRTADSIGIKLPDTLIAMADHVID